jgi:transposase
MSTHAKELKGCRYALWRNPEDLTPRQANKLAWIAKVNTKPYRAYLMKEQLRIAIRTKGVLSHHARRVARLGAVLSDPRLRRVGRKVKKNIKGIEAAMLHNLSNALIESTHTKLRVLHRMAFGFRQPEHLIALALLDRGGYCPPLPGRGHSSAPALAALG